MFVNSKKSKLRIILIAVLLTAIVGVVVWKYIGDISYRAQKPKGNYSDGFLYNETFYECSKEIGGDWVEASVGWSGDRGYYFRPKNHTDLDKFCRINAVIEYGSVIDILKRDDVNKIIEKYDTSQSWVRALGHKYINDKEYLNRILPAYSHIKIDCIIVVHSPDGTRFFIEDGEIHTSHVDHKYLEVDSTEFLGSLGNASNDDVSNFWLGLH